MVADFLCITSWEIPYVATCVERRIAVEDLAVKSGFRRPDSVCRSDDWCEVATNNDIVSRIFGFANEARHAIGAIHAVDPFKAIAPEINLMERWFVDHKLV